MVMTKIKNLLNQRMMKMTSH